MLLGRGHERLSQVRKMFPGGGDGGKSAPRSLEWSICLLAHEMAHYPLFRASHRPTPLLRRIAPVKSGRGRIAHWPRAFHPHGLIPGSLFAAELHQFGNFSGAPVQGLGQLLPALLERDAKSCSLSSIRESLRVHRRDGLEFRSADIIGIC